MHLPISRIEAIHINREGSISYDIVHDLIIDSECTLEDLFSVMHCMDTMTLWFDDSINKQKWRGFSKRYMGGKSSPVIKKQIEQGKSITKKFSQYITNSCAITKMLTWFTIDISPASKEEKEHRKTHTDQVIMYSEKIYDHLKERPKDMKLSKLEENTLEIIKEAGMEWTFTFVACIHDAFKLSKCGEHGAMASYLFTSLCVNNRIDTKNVIIGQMIQALEIHSRKSLDKKNEYNIYAKILMDADTLTKYSIENMLQKWHEKYPEGTTFEFAYKDTLKVINEYKGYTPMYKELKKQKLEQLQYDYIQYQQKELFEGGQSNGTV